MRERLETDFVSDFADAQVRIEQKIPGFFHANARNVLGEVQAGRFFEHFAKVEGAGVDRLGHLAQGKVFRLIFNNEFLRPLDHRRFGVFTVDNNLVADHRNMLGKDAEQFDHRLVLFGRQHLGSKIDALQPFPAHLQTPFGDEPGRALDLGGRGFFAQHLAGLEEADQLLAQTNRHRRIHQSKLASYGRGFKPGPFRELLLHLQTGRARPAFFGQHGAQGVLVALAVVRQLP